MDMMHSFEWAWGSTLGASHARRGQNNQDAAWVEASSSALAAVVCDGCGSGEFSEVGAQLGSRLIAKALCQHAAELRPTKAAKVLEQVRAQVLRRIQDLAQAMGGDYAETLSEFFLFTVVGALITPKTAAVFSIGDGVVSINGKVKKLISHDDCPFYMTYALTDLNQQQPEDFKFRIIDCLPTPDVKNLILGSDGAAVLSEIAAERIPGKDEKIGAFDQFTARNRYFRVPDALSRFLRRLNHSQMTVDWKKRRVSRSQGLLDDDATLVALRRVHRS